MRRLFLGCLRMCILLFIFMQLTRLHVLASSLDSINMVKFKGGSVRVTLSLGGGVPSNYHVTGGGTPQLTLILPNTTLNQRMNRLAYPGPQGTALVGLTLSPVGQELDVGLSLSSAVQVIARASSGLIIIDVAPAHAPARGPGALLPGPPATASSSLTGGKLYEVIPLKYADVSEVAGVLVEGHEITPNDTFTPAGSIFSLPTSVNGVPTTQTNPAYNPNLGAQNQQPLSVGQRITEGIAIDRRLNAVILSGTQDEIDQIKAVIEKIDVPLPSVMLECQVVELTETAAKDVGIDLSAGGQLAMLSFTSRSQNVVAGEIDLAARVFAAIARGGGHILATPRVLSLNGNLSSILSGDALPIITTTTIPGPPVLIQQTVNYIAVGVNLQIQPRIANDGNVTSHIFAEVSSVTAFVTTPQGPVPQISLRQTTTQATVKDGEPFIIGGLLRDEEITNMSRIPILGDLPLIGGLFRARHDTNLRTNLFIIITPRIIHQIGSSEPGSIPPGLPQPRVPGPIPTTPSPQPSATP